MQARCDAFNSGAWRSLIDDSMRVAHQASVSASRKRRRERGDDLDRRARRALQLVQLGECSAGRQALEGAQVAQGDAATLRSLRDATRRPPRPRSPMPTWIEDVQAATPFVLDLEIFLQNLRSSRRGAAAGPSGMTTDHLFPLLESERDSLKLHQFATTLARAEVPAEIVDLIRLGRITALRKKDGGVRGITVRDVLRRLIARTIAKQVSSAVESATSPFQFALSTKAGCECVAHIIQSLTDTDAETTVVSVDGVGAFDLISRNSMLQGLLSLEQGDQILPFVRQFYGRPSTHIWEDDMGNVHNIAQGGLYAT